MEIENNLILNSRVLDSEEKFIKQLLFSSKNIVSNSDFNKKGLSNRNMMFF